MVITNIKHELIGGDSLSYKVKRKQIGHFLYYKQCRIVFIRFRQHLSLAQTVVFRSVRSDFSYGTRFPSPRMVNDKFCVFSEFPVDHIFITFGNTCKITESMDPEFFKPPGNSGAETPEVSKRSMPPELPAE